MRAGVGVGYGGTRHDTTRAVCLTSACYLAKTVPQSQCTASRLRRSKVATPQAAAIAQRLASAGHPVTQRRFFVSSQATGK